MNFPWRGVKASLSWRLRLVECAGASVGQPGQCKPDVKKRSTCSKGSREVWGWPPGPALHGELYLLPGAPLGAQE